MSTYKLVEKLSNIQREIKAPKNNYNSFGNYNYRNVESILEAFKPYEDKFKVALILYDDIVQIGDRIYVKATAKLLDIETDTCIEATAFARETIAKKGMDDSQITGSASSYARKYALNGLLLLDDNKDADTEEYRGSQSSKKGSDSKPARKMPPKPATEPQLEQILDEMVRTGVTEAQIKERYSLSNWDDITEEIAERVLRALRRCESKVPEPSPDLPPDVPEYPEIPFK